MMDQKSALVTRRGEACARCGAPFVCGARAAVTEGKCWCAALPSLDAIPDPNRACLCPACLRAALVAAGQVID